VFDFIPSTAGLEYIEEYYNGLEGLKLEILLEMMGKLMQIGD